MSLGDILGLAALHFLKVLNVEYLYLVISRDHFEGPNLVTPNPVKPCLAWETRKRKQNPPSRQLNHER